MQEQEQISPGPRGVVINTASLAAYFAPPGQPIYAVTKGTLYEAKLMNKAGVATLSRAMKLMEKQTGVYVSAVCPGFIDTKLASAVPKQFVQATQGWNVTSVTYSQCR
jgi:NAD(P)-dependent dehydrogenase (short-subunit alcohol dehydrogenase family)